MEDRKPLFVIDASVILKWLWKEEDFEIAAEMRKKFIEENIMLGVPTHAFAEVMNTVGRQEPELAMPFLSQLYILKIMEYTFGLALYSLALEIMQKLDKVSFYDAAYHAVALHHKGTFVTADADYYKKAKKLGNIKLLKDY